MNAIDQLGFLRAQIAELAEQEKALVKQVKELGEGGHDGSLFHANVTTSVRESLDQEYVRSLLTTRQLNKAKRLTTVVTVRLTARLKQAA